jgi:hypothetical protein
MEALLMIDPPPEAIMIGSVLRVTFAAPSRLIPRIFRQWPVGVSSTEAIE